jgi:zinc transporter, ZIP family
VTELVLATRRVVSEHRALLGLTALSLIVLVAALYGLQQAELALEAAVEGLPVLAAALLATLATALATGAGALPVLFTRTISERTQATMLGFAAGIMLAASIFSLLLPALEAGTAQTGSTAGGATIAAIGLLAGAALLLALDHLVPHEHLAQGARGMQPQKVRRVWLFVFAITLHNLPEGLAIGVAFAADGATTGLPLALGIAVQNVPEGLAVALAMLTLNYTPAQAVLIALATGLVEPIGGLLGAGAIVLSGALLPWGLAFAAGAMLFVISQEIIPETHRNGRESSASVGLFLGFVLMMMFDTLLG